MVGGKANWGMVETSRSGLLIDGRQATVSALTHQYEDAQGHHKYC
jgi:hypothetical protein